MSAKYIPVRVYKFYVDPNDGVEAEKRECYGLSDTIPACAYRESPTVRKSIDVFWNFTSLSNFHVNPTLFCPNVSAFAMSAGGKIYRPDSIEGVEHPETKTVSVTQSHPILNCAKVRSRPQKPRVHIPLRPIYAV
jgi:hypothetical protein